MVKIACHVVNGIMIRLSQEGFDDGTGNKPMVHDGPGVRLNGPSALHTGAGNTAPPDLPPVVTEVDDEWWAAWLKQNAQSPLVTMKQVHLLDEEKTKDQNPT